MSTRPSYFVRSQAPDPESVKKAFSWLVKNSKPRGFLAVHVYRNLEEVIQDVIRRCGCEGVEGRNIDDFECRN